MGRSGAARRRPAPHRAGGAYFPGTEADWHLPIGDEAALPAISSAIESMPVGMRAKAFSEVDGPAEEQKIDSSADVGIAWLHRDGAPAGSTDLHADAVRAVDWPAGNTERFRSWKSEPVKADSD